MSSKHTTPLLKLWLKWKALRLPWRRRFLAGTDLHGNTFWEFRERDSPKAGRWRRIVQYSQATHYGDVKVSPAWHQWLRHTRATAPSFEEQQADVVRRERMKVLAAEADARWEAKPRIADPEGAGATGHQAIDAGEDGSCPEQEGRHPEQGLRPGRDIKETDDPWKRTKGGPSEDWQPQTWDPATTKR